MLRRDFLKTVLVAVTAPSLPTPKPIATGTWQGSGTPCLNVVCDSGWRWCNTVVTYDAFDLAAWKRAKDAMLYREVCKALDNHLWLPPLKA